MKSGKTAGNKMVISLFPKTYFCITENLPLNERAPRGIADKYINLFIHDIQKLNLNEDPEVEFDGTLKELLKSNINKYFSGLNSKDGKINVIHSDFLKTLSSKLYNDLYEKISEGNITEALLWKQYEHIKTDKVSVEEVKKWFFKYFKDPNSDDAYKMLICEKYSDEFRNLILIFATLYGNKFASTQIKETLETLINKSISANAYDGLTTKQPEFSKSETVTQLLKFNSSFNSNPDIQALYNNLELFYRHTVYCKTGEKINGYDKGANIRHIEDLGNIHQLVQYFTFFEAIYIYLSVSGEPFDMIDDLFRYRFMLATNNPIIQKEELFPLIGSYNNICCLYDNWTRAIGRKTLTFVYEPNEIYLGEFDLHDSYIAYKFVKKDIAVQDIFINDRKYLIKRTRGNHICICDEQGGTIAGLSFEMAGDMINITSVSHNTEMSDKALRALPILILILQWTELIDTSYKGIAVPNVLVDKNIREHFTNAGFREQSDGQESLIWENLLYISEES